MNGDLSVHVLCCPPRAFTLPNDWPSLKPLTANGQAFCSPPWRPTTCQVTVATTAEGTDPWQLTLILPLVWRVWCVTFIPDFSLKGFMHSDVSHLLNRLCMCHSTVWRTPVHGSERNEISNTEQISFELLHNFTLEFKYANKGWVAVNPVTLNFIITAAGG